MSNTENLMNQTKYIPGLHCPACFGTENQKMLRAETAHNSHSRYCDAYICSACGVEEALRGFFWRERALQRGFALNTQ